MGASLKVLPFPHSGVGKWLKEALSPRTWIRAAQNWRWLENICSEARTLKRPSLGSWSRPLEAQELWLSFKSVVIPKEFQDFSLLKIRQRWFSLVVLYSIFQESPFGTKSKRNSKEIMKFIPLQVGSPFSLRAPSYSVSLWNPQEPPPLPHGWIELSQSYVIREWWVWHIYSVVCLSDAVLGSLKSLLAVPTLVLSCDLGPTTYTLWDLRGLLWTSISMSVMWRCWIACPISFLCHSQMFSLSLWHYG